MKKWISIVVFLFLGSIFSIQTYQSNQVKPTNSKCSYFRTGIFENRCESGHNSRFKRFSTYQVQEYNSLFIKEKIVWTGPCSYTVTLLETNDPEISDFIGDFIKVKMVNVEKNKYKTMEQGSSGKTSSCVETKIGEIPTNN
ncbi:hypothetical protein LEP1GSC202_2013 [Leptospira yanagawae serovar Saopaulo str. Sao Paulo = ATCC 700523]|uniref:Uncharacterized protein n=1 Tax=Leptospira yanagawae serovar Saopaulo str. Sao Paulo = ATCC 700523 TaxID=1249483 RepID=A0A5E8HD93_9LEPT|nr:hypothetical protein [Leptospira yanagawae]EOQ88852.1 hypothetical protein LEP1GSC202_2013 [Leptospira yanagawae serovar Saopaulo str. Sao Paulo = ATCC 700523]